MSHWLVRQNIGQAEAQWSSEVSKISGMTVDTAREHAESDAEIRFFVYFRETVNIPGVGVLNPGDVAFFKGHPTFAEVPQCDTYVREIVPRNIAWVQTEPPELDSNGLDEIEDTFFTHIIVSFFHLDAGPKLVYNGPNRFPSQFDQLWKRYRRMQSGPHYKTMMISVGGWGSNTWLNAEGEEYQGAYVIAQFVTASGFDGVDFNFEGDFIYRNETRWLTVLAKLVGYLGDLLPEDKLITITPIWDNTFAQVQAIQKEGRSHRSYPKYLYGKKWRDMIDWINAQFYTYIGEIARPEPDPVGEYRNLLIPDSIHREGPYPPDQISTDRLVAGFPLESGKGSSSPVTFNPDERNKAFDAVQILNQTAGFAGVFVWRWEDTRIPPSLWWGKSMETALGRSQ